MESIIKDSPTKTRRKFDKSFKCEVVRNWLSSGKSAAVIAKRASAIVIAHNHPGGDPTPSEADIRVTRELIRAGQLLKIEVLDHVIMGRSTTERPRDYTSLRELGYFS
jgi:proteasome lid subunit RPN8/RPN11